MSEQLEEIMSKSKPNRTIMLVTLILTISVGISMIINPEILSMEPFVLIVIASVLLGIWFELREMNNQRSNPEK